MLRKKMQNNFWIGLDKDEASENIPEPVEKAEIIVEGIVLKDEASKNDTSGENVTDALAKTEITEEGT